MIHPKKELQDFKRFREVLKILTEEGFGFILDELKVLDHVPLTTRIMNQKRETRPERVRETIEKLGTTYIKFGQILAERPDMVPERYIEELQELQDSVEPFDENKARSIIDEEIGLEKFSKFHEEPLAAASIAQVHRAKLEDGKEVVIKVTRPGIEKKIEKDLDIINYLAESGEKHSKHLKGMEIVKFVKEFSNWTRQELDMEKECLNAQIFKENIEKKEENVYVPEVYPELTTRKVLVMEYIEGEKCCRETIDKYDLDPQEISRTVIKSSMRQSIIYGFFHADPHPSNILISEDGKVNFLDFGMMGKVSDEVGEKMGLMLLYMIREDIDGIMKCLTDLGTMTEEFNEENARDMVEDKVLLLKNTSLKQHSITKELFDLFVQLSDEGLHMPSNLALMGKSLVTMEGIGMTVYPDFRITGEYESMVKEILEQKNSPKQLTEDFAVDLIKNKDLIRKLPSKINQKLESGGEKAINVETKRPDLELLPAALILSSCALIAASVLSRIFLYIGLIELAYGIYLHHN